MQNMSCEMPGWMKHKLGSRLLGEISIKYADDITHLKGNEESEKGGLKLNIQKTKIMASGPISSWQIDVETMATVRDFIFLGSKITANGDCSYEIKNTCSSKEKLWQN